MPPNLRYHISKTSIFGVNGHFEHHNDYATQLITVVIKMIPLQWLNFLG